VNQMARILASVDGRLSAIAAPQLEGQLHSPENSTARIWEAAFNILLDAIVQHQGVEAGKRFFDKWCKLPNLAPTLSERKNADMKEVDDMGEFVPIVGDYDPDAGEKVVTPSLQVIRTLTTPAIEALGGWKTKLGAELLELEKNKSVLGSVKSDREQNVVTGNTTRAITSEVQREIILWGMEMYSRMGLDDEAVGFAISPLVANMVRERVGIFAGDADDTEDGLRLEEQES
jgi:hypothetical protein